MGPQWPKLTGDWTVANSAVGSFGTLDTDADANKVVIAMTRNGRINGYRTGAAACAAADWPQFHHDRANSGTWSRDAIAPGRPTAATFSDGHLRFTAPGDDLLCGTADRYEVRTSDKPITGTTFDAAQRVDVAAKPKAAGAAEDIALPAVKRYVAVRALDEPGTPGRPATVDGGKPGRGGGKPR
jgi:hypothetical protein